MGCSSCGSGGCSKEGKGCNRCSTMNTFDWLQDMHQPDQLFDVVEIKFKGGRKEFYRNVNNLILYTGDEVVVESSPGHHIGVISLQGELVRLQMKKYNVEYNEDLNIIYRKTTKRDLERFQDSRNRELSTLFRAREIIRELKLGMKLSDVEYQADNTKATFYYSAEDRVDFRELIKLLAKEFKIRVEMRQISLRQEAGRLGGIGSCGRELCCATWLTNFKSVQTSAARYQNLSLNPSKLSGQCGRLKCCLNYELDTYLEAIEDFPEVQAPLLTEQGKAYHQKTDIFKRLMWFGYEGENTWHPITVDRVKEVIALNKKGKKVYSLETDIVDEEIPEQVNSDLDKLDKKLKKKNFQGNNKKKKRRKKRYPSANQRNKKPNA